VGGVAGDKRCRDKPAVLYLQIVDFGIVQNVDPHFVCGGIVGIDQGLAAAQKKTVGPGQVERAAHGRLKHAAQPGHPGSQVVGLANR
jgi:hypothetical protein